MTLILSSARPSASAEGANQRLAPTAPSPVKTLRRFHESIVAPPSVGGRRAGRYGRERPANEIEQASSRKQAGDYPWQRSTDHAKALLQAIDCAAPTDPRLRNLAPDLSLTPLVSIIETLEPPDVARVSFSAEESHAKTSGGIPSASDQFTALLEGLDALASAIQGAVESRTSVQSSGMASASDEHRWIGRSPAQDVVDAGFQKEVIGLFALEAHEWLAQIQMAVRQLAEGANGTLRPKLYGILLQGISNLAKSASTVQLQNIEQMASNLLPILHDVGRQEPRAMTAALQSLQEGLDRISLAVRRLGGNHENKSIGTDDDLVDTVSEPVQASPTSATELPDAPKVKTPLTASFGVPLIHALRDLQQARARSMQPARDVLEAVIQRAEREGDHLQVADVGRILTELDRLDEDFLQEIRRRVPIISSTLASLRAQGVTDFVTTSQLDPILEQVESLYDLAGRVQATMITMFLQGLRSFLMVAAYRKTSTMAQRLETVETRIHALIPMAEQWRNIGRVERSAISEILPS